MADMYEDTFQGDDLYPNDGAYFSAVDEPVEQKEEKAKERGKARAAIPMLKEIIARFDKRIAFFQSIGSVPDDVMLNEVEFMHTIAANKIAVVNLQAEKEYLQSLLDEK